MTPLNLVPCMVPPLASTKKLIMKSALAGAFVSPSLLRLPLAYVASLLPPRPFDPACGEAPSFYRMTMVVCHKHSIQGRCNNHTGHELRVSA